MSSITAVIEDVKKDQTKNGKDIYKVKIDGKTYTTFDERVAKDAFARKGQKVVADVEVKQSGEFTNYNLKGVTAAAEQAQIPSVAGEREDAIARAVALKAAVDFQAGKGSVADVKLAADEFLAWLTGQGVIRVGDIVQRGPADPDADDIPFAPTV